MAELLKSTGLCFPLDMLADRLPNMRWLCLLGSNMADDILVLFITGVILGFGLDYFKLKSNSSGFSALFN